MKTIKYLSETLKITNWGDMPFNDNGYLEGKTNDNRYIELDCSMLPGEDWSNWDEFEKDTQSSDYDDWEYVKIVNIGEYMD